MLVFKLHIHMKYKQVNKQLYDYKRADFMKIKDELNSIDWHAFMNKYNGTEKCWVEFKELLLSLEKKYVPLKKLATKRNNKAVWLTYKAKNLVSKKKKCMKNTRIKIIQPSEKSIR